MLKKLFVLTQYLLPKHGLSILLGKLADCSYAPIKNWLISYFCELYKVDLNDAIIEDRTAYPTFNDFFIRKLKPSARPISDNPQQIVSPVDGTIAELGPISKNRLAQAKNHYFNLETLFGGDTASAQAFYNGRYATIYLAPNNYHRVHIPIDATLTKTIFIPGKLFSVNHMTTHLIPNLYSRNERYVALFDTSVGPMAIIMVGALIVGSMQMAWMKKPLRAQQIISDTPSTTLTFKKGDELGYFKLGSTVILLFADDAVQLLDGLNAGTSVQVGQLLATATNFSLSKVL